MTSWWSTLGATGRGGSSPPRSWPGRPPRTSRYRCTTDGTTSACRCGSTAMTPGTPPPGGAGRCRKRAVPWRLRVRETKRRRAILHVRTPIGHDRNVGTRPRFLSMATSGEMEVEAMIRPVVEGAGLELVEADFRREAGRRILRVTVERDPERGPLDLDAISEVSERISRRLDLERFDPPGGPYTLEVNSPGVERPLRTARDFERHVGQRVRVRTHEPVDGSRAHLGT